jgi:prephenate dehydrogenase
MGGSLAGALRGRCQKVTGVARRPDTVQQAIHRGLVDEATTDLANVVGHADVLVLATPVRATITLLAETGEQIAAGCLVMDLGSTKAEIVAAMEQLPEGIEPLGGHPMCGKEVAGIAAADPALYTDCTFVITPLTRTSAAAQTLGEEIVRAAGARPLVLSAERHDQLVAVISHLPYLLACGLVGIAQEASLSDAAIWAVASSGFASTSRLAASDVTMMLDILATNREAVLGAAEAFQARLTMLLEIVCSGDESAARAQLSAIREQRLRIGRTAASKPQPPPGGIS